MAYSGDPPASVQGSIDYVLSLFDSWLVLSSAYPVRVNFTWANLTAELPGVLGYTVPVWTGFGSNQVAGTVFLSPLCGWRLPLLMGTHNQLRGWRGITSTSSAPHSRS